MSLMIMSWISTGPTHTRTLAFHCIDGAHKGDDGPHMKPIGKNSTFEENHQKNPKFAILKSRFLREKIIFFIQVFFSDKI